MSLYANSFVLGDCDYPSSRNDEFFKSKDHPIECATCELVVFALEEWLIDPTDEQAVSRIQ